jgi:hypothetical protein
MPLCAKRAIARLGMILVFIPSDANCAKRPAQSNVANLPNSVARKFNHG